MGTFDKMKVKRLQPQALHVFGVFHGKDEVTSSILVEGSTQSRLSVRIGAFFISLSFPYFPLFFGIFSPYNGYLMGTNFLRSAL